MAGLEPRATPGAAGVLAVGSAAKRAQLAAGPRAVYQAVLRAFAITGQPPGLHTLQQAARAHRLEVAQVLAGLAAADVLGLDSQGRIRMAYPFSAAPTAHQVAIADGPRVYAMCAIDALGIPAMLHTDAVITSADPLTGEPVTITVTRGITRWHPPAAVVFTGCTPGCGPAENTCCGYLNFFASPATARDWASQHPEVTGSVLDQAAAQELGTQTFGKLLEDGG
jgi:hypothetical protein